MSHPFIPFTDTARLEAIFLEQGQYIENVHHFLHNTGAISLSDMTALAGAYKNWWNLGLKTMASTDVTLVKIRVKDLTTENAPGIEYTTGLPLAGTHASPALPNNVTVVCKTTTGYSGRSYRGRVYVIGLCEDAVTGNTVDAGIVTQINTQYGNMISSPPTDWTWVVASMMHNLTWRTTGVSTAITAVSTDPYVDSQRRRLTGRGR